MAKNTFENPKKNAHSIPDGWLPAVESCIREHLSDPDFSVEKLCQLLAVSRPVLYRHLKTVTGHSPKRYIIVLRLKRAKELLGKGGYYIKEVAYECGFADAKYFSTAFRRHFGYAPSFLKLKK